MKITSLIIAGILGTALAAQGDIIIEDASYARLYDTDVTKDGIGDTTADHILNVGTKGSSTGWDVNSGIAFQMTGATAGDLLTADFSISYTGNTGDPTAWNVDVYATRVNSSSAFVASDYQNGTLLMEDFVTSASGTGVKSLNTPGQANLLSYLQSNWVEDDYLFITLKSDPAIIDIDANNTYNFSSGAPGWTAAKSDAQLTLTTAIPEPSALALLGMGGAMLMTVCRRNSWK